MGFDFLDRVTFHVRREMVNRHFSGLRRPSPLCEVRGGKDGGGGNPCASPVGTRMSISVPFRERFLLPSKGCTSQGFRIFFRLCQRPTNFDSERPIPFRTDNEKDPRNMKRHILAVAGLGLALFGCDSSSVVATQTPANQPAGQVAVHIHLGPVGVLARTAEMIPDRLVLTLASVAADTTRDTIELYGSGQVIKSYLLASGRSWDLSATGLDRTGNMLYTGKESFKVESDSKLKVDLKLDALFSSVRMNFPVRGGASRFRFDVDGEVWGDSIMGLGVREGDTVRLSHDYLGASRQGIDHSFALTVSGNRGDKDTVLYALDTTIKVVSGESKGGRLVLKWVAPQVPRDGVAELAVTFGSMGKLDFDMDYEGMPSVCKPWENKSGLAWNEQIEYGTLCDARDSLAYRTVNIGSQTWMAQNLNYAGSAWAPVGACSNNDPSACEKFGRLYTFDQAIGDSMLGKPNAATVQGICPDGWHAPGQIELELMLSVVAKASGSGRAGYFLKSQSGWPAIVKGNGVDAFGFRALPQRESGTIGSWWSSAAQLDDRGLLKAFLLGMRGDAIDAWVGMNSSMSPSIGFPMRCVKN